MPKYEILETTKEHDGHVLHRIRSLVELELSNVRPGELGGWIASEPNLSQEGECWVYPNAMVLEDASVQGDCRINDCAEIRGKAHLSDFVLVHDSAVIEGDVVIDQTCTIRGTTNIFGNAHISCGQDGPQIIEGAAIDFDVSYGNEYAVFSFADDSGLTVAVSKSARVCVTPTWTVERWSGSLNEFAEYAVANDHGIDSLPWTYELAGAYVERWRV